LTVSGWAVALSGLAAVLGVLTLLWLVSLRTGDASIIDAFWGPGFALVAFAYHLVDRQLGPRTALVLTLVLVWAARLGIHLFRRNRSRGEDPRYAAMRAEHGERWGRVSLFRVFWLQGVILWVVSMPLFAAVRAPGDLGALDFLGAMLVLVGLSLETVADLQLTRFRADPANRGRVLDTGLWRYSRHPNYFGDAVVWWGFYAIAGAAGAWWTVFAPVIMTWLLTRVSGVPLLEKGLSETRPGYAEYVRRTSAFVPWLPRK
jgi:steroid 5-alpha reductase family enzyme